MGGTQHTASHCSRGPGFLLEEAGHRRCVPFLDLLLLLLLLGAGLRQFWLQSWRLCHHALSVCTVFVYSSTSRSSRAIGCDHGRVCALERAAARCCTCCCCSAYSCSSWKTIPLTTSVARWWQRRWWCCSTCCSLCCCCCCACCRCGIACAYTTLRCRGCNSPAPAAAKLAAGVQRTSWPSTVACVASAGTATTATVAVGGFGFG